DFDRPGPAPPGPPGVTGPAAAAPRQGAVRGRARAGRRWRPPFAPSHDRLRVPGRETPPPNGRGDDDAERTNPDPRGHDRSGATRIRRYDARARDHTQDLHLPR